MSAINGRVEASQSRSFSTYAEASEFVDTLDRYAFEGILVREDGYRVLFNQDIQNEVREAVQQGRISTISEAGNVSIIVSTPCGSRVVYAHIDEADLKDLETNFVYGE